LALVHAGEQIVPAGQVRGGDGGTIYRPHVEVNLGNGMEWLGQFIEVRVDGKIQKIGQSASARARSGRY